MSKNIIISICLLLIICYAIFMFESSSNSLTNIQKLDKEKLIEGTYISETKSDTPNFTHVFTIYLRSVKDSSTEYTNSSTTSTLTLDNNLIIKREGGTSPSISNEGGFYVYYNNLHGLTVIVKNNDADDTTKFNILSHELPLQKWISVAITVSTYSIDIYYDGYLVATSTFEHKNSTDLTLYGKNITIGQETSGVDGWMTNYIYYDEILDINKIKNISIDFNNSYNTKVKDVYGANVILSKGDDEIGKLSI